ncbi:MAG: Rid family hydrolase [Prevotella sp.]
MDRTHWTMKKKYIYDNAAVETFVFDNGNEVREAHVMIHATEPTAPFSQQLSAVVEALNTLLADELKEYQPVFKRYFVSDAANQADEIYVTETEACCCALSVIEQPPLDGTKVAMWCYLMTDVKTSVLESGLYCAEHGRYRHLWSGSAHNLAANSEYQTRLLFNEYIVQLAKEGCTLKDNCIRTWFFVNDVDLNYGGVVRARNRTFFTQGLTNDTHFIASTGIGGRQADPNVLTQMDAYAISGISPEQVKHLYAPTHLNRTSDYGVSFERGTTVDYADRRHVFISGTASIDNKGQIVHPKDIVNQTDRMIENVEALLKEAECGFDNVGQMIVYLRDISDYAVVSHKMKQRFPDTPMVIVFAPVCRPGWLIEMECFATLNVEG